MQQLVPVILCGGSGTRLWPLSRKDFPKQFLALSDTTSLFQKAIERIHGISNSEFCIDNILIVTNEEHRFLVLDQLRELKNIPTKLLLEPSVKNTAPALTLAALEAMQGDMDPILIVSPADQTIQNIKAFTKALQISASVAAAGGIVVLGIKPTAVETGYGYINYNPQSGERGEFKVIQFAEKPDIKTAAKYVSSGKYMWNSGIFVLRASTWLKVIAQFRADIYSASRIAWQGKSYDRVGDTVFIRPEKKAFLQIPPESIDYAVIEQCPITGFPIDMIELDAGWSDLGAWGAVWQAQEDKADEHGNVISGDVLHIGSKKNLVYATSRLVGTVGVENLVIIETADAVLVASHEHSQEVKHIVTQLETNSREEQNLHRKVHRPWGWYDSIDAGDRFKVKRIQVKPGACLSLQMHHHRAEHWIVVRGIAEVINGEQVITLHENESTFIPQGQKHRLANPGLEPLEIIEVQSGAYLGEDDIVRFEDVYGRK